MPKTIIKRRKFMKRKMFLIVISVLVLCLTCGMLFVACNDKNEGNDNPDDDHGTTTGSAFDTFKDVVFELEDVKLDTTGAKEFNFGLDVTAADDASKSLFSLAFETLGGEEYIYGSVNGGAMTKFNGFDLGGTVETVLSWFGDSISIKGIPVELNANGFLGGVGGELLSALIGDAKVSSDGSAYAIVLNLEGVVGLISGDDALLNLDQMIADAGLGDIFGMIIPAIGGLITPDGSDDASPATVTELVEAIADNYTLTFYFGFEDNTGKDAAAEKAAQPFGDLALSSKVMAAREADARNLLNFTLDGTAEFKDEEGRDIQHCECCLFPAANDDISWVAFVEIKDCKPKNIADYKEKVKEQIISTVQLFRNAHITTGQQKIYGIISFPRKRKTGFNETIFTDYTEYKRLYTEYHIHFYPTNTVQIKNGEILELIKT